MKRAVFLAVGVWLVSCGRVDDAGPGAAGNGSAGGGGFGAGTGGGAGQPMLDIPPSAGAFDAGFYPPPFDKNSCPAPVSQFSDGELTCLTRAELQNMKPLKLELEGGVSALGPPSSWRCPELSELSSGTACGGEGSCCYSPQCGPLLERGGSSSAEAGSAGALGDGGSPPDPKRCCYYVEEICGV